MVLDTETALLLAKGAKGQAAAALVQDVLSSPSIYNFAEFMALPGIQALQQSHPQHYLTLQLFSWGRLQDFNQETMLSFTESSKRKLLILTLLSACKGKRVVDYSMLMQELGLSSVRQVEDLIISAIEQDLLVGKLDQKRSSLVVSSSKARDVQQDDIPHLISALSNWLGNTQGLLDYLKNSAISVENEIKALELEEKDWEERVKQLSSKISVSAEGGLSIGKKGKRPLGADNPFAMPSGSRSGGRRR